jgi:hypothetical protein
MSDDPLFTRLHEDAANKVNFAADYSDLTAGEQQVTILKVTIVYPEAPQKGLAAPGKEASLRYIFSVLTKEGVPIDTAFTVFCPMKATFIHSRIMGLIAQSCGLAEKEATPGSFAGRQALVRLGLQQIPGRPPLWVVSNWLIPVENGPPDQLYSDEREQFNLSGKTLGQLVPPPQTVSADRPAVSLPKAKAPKAEAPKAEAPKAEAPKAEETESMPDAAMDFISGLDDPLGKPESEADAANAV